METMVRDIEPPFLVIKPCPSEDEFYRLAGEDTDWEYLDGRIVMHSPASERHEDLFRFLLTLLSYYLDSAGGATVRGSRYPMRLDPSWSPEPDILAVVDARRQFLGRQRLEGPADLVIEIVSESDSHVIYKEKLPRYIEAGIREIWIVDPLREELLADRLTARGRERQTLSRGRLVSSVLSGFWIHAEWLWRPKLPSSCQCLSDILGPAAAP